MKVLIVEDEPALQVQLVQIVQGMGSDFKVDSSVSADDTIQFMETQKLNPHYGYDLIVSDVSLEGKHDGFDLWRACKEQFPQTRFIFISGIPVTDFLEKVQDDPACPPYLSKPFSLSDFKLLVKDVLGLE